MMKFGPMILIVGCGPCTSWKENSLPPCQEVVVLALMESCTFLEDMMTKDTAIDFILLICEQEMEPTFGKKSPVLKDNHPHHVINSLAGYIKTD